MNYYIQVASHQWFIPRSHSADDAGYVLRIASSLLNSFPPFFPSFRLLNWSITSLTGKPYTLHSRCTASSPYSRRKSSSGHWELSSTNKSWTICCELPGNLCIRELIIACRNCDLFMLPLLFLLLFNAFKHWIHYFRISSIQTRVARFSLWQPRTLSSPPLQWYFS